MIHETYCWALQQLAPGAEWHLTGDDLNTLQWFSDHIPQPSNAEIEAKAQTYPRD